MASITFEHVTKRFDDSAAVDDLSIDVADGEFLVLVGPSGCGKTTALRMLAGLEEITRRPHPHRRPRRQQRRSGRAQRRDGLPVVRALPAHDRLRQPRVQPAQLRRAEGRRSSGACSEAANVLELGELLKRKPKQLSGGQRQRVALGRAIVREPSAFLMDEPLSNLDAALRVQTRAEILKLQKRLGTTTIYVTHDQVEAMTMGDRIAVMSKGVLQQIGTPEELYTRPANTFVAQLHRLAGDEPAAVVASSASEARASSPASGPSTSSSGTGAPAARSYRGDVEVVEYLGDEQLAHLRLGDHEIVVKLPVEPRLQAGDAGDVLGAAAEGAALRRGEHARGRTGRLAVPLTVLDGSTFCVCDERGDVDGIATASGFFASDTRFLSRSVLTLGGERLEPLSHDQPAPHLAAFVLRNPLVDGLEPNELVHRARALRRRLHGGADHRREPRPPPRRGRARPGARGRLRGHLRRQGARARIREAERRTASAVAAAGTRRKRHARVRGRRDIRRARSSICRSPSASVRAPRDSRSSSSRASAGASSSACSRSSTGQRRSRARLSRASSTKSADVRRSRSPHGVRPRHACAHAGTTSCTRGTARSPISPACECARASPTSAGCSPRARRGS